VTVSAALIACSNGLGHVRRVLMIASELKKVGHRATVFAPKSSVQKLATSLPVEINFCIKDFDTVTSAKGLRDGDPRVLDWEQRLPAIDSFDLVLSDNLPEVLAVRPDAWLSGNFLWHEVLYGISDAYFQRARDLLETYKPRILTYGGLSVIEDVSNLQINECAIPNPKITRCRTPRDSLLITCGTGGEVELVYKDFVESLTKDRVKPFTQVFVEPKLVPRNPKKWISPASFTTTMFGRTLVAICRPGFGIVSDCLRYKIGMVNVFEQENKEMLRSAQVLQSEGLGKTSSDLNSALVAACQYASDPYMQELQYSSATQFLERKYPKVVDVLLDLDNPNSTVK